MILTLKDTKASASIDSLGAQLISYRDSAARNTSGSVIPAIGPTAPLSCFPSWAG